MPEGTDAKRQLIEPEHPELSIRRQCELMGLNRASYYYEPATETPLNLTLMRLLDEAYTAHPFYGRRRLTLYLHQRGYGVNEKRVRRLMQTMGLEAIYPRPRTTVVDQAHRIYPYLLHGIEIGRVNQVWSSDITYIPLANGFMYLVAVIDWYSRYVLAWQLSNTLDTSFCVAALQQALRVGRPAIFNTDQGSQFTADAFTSLLAAAGIRISMDSKGRALDNIFIERFWRTLKYEDIYLKHYPTVPLLYSGLRDYFAFYNDERPHQSLDNQTPAAVFLAAPGSAT